MKASQKNLDKLSDELKSNYSETEYRVMTNSLKFKDLPEMAEKLSIARPLERHSGPGRVHGIRPVAGGLRSGRAGRNPQRAAARSPVPGRSLQHASRTELGPQRPEEDCK